MKGSAKAKSHMMKSKMHAEKARMHSEAAHQAMSDSDDKMPKKKPGKMAKKRKGAY